MTISMQLARLGRQREELAGPGADGLEDQRAVARGAGGQEDGLGLELVKAGDQLDGLVRVGVEGDHAEVGGDLGDPAGHAPDSW